MAMAFAGAGSAMAESTELCALDPGTAPTAPCPEGEAITSVHETSVGKAKLLANPRVECNVLFSSTSVGAAAAPQVIEGPFPHTNCGCTVREGTGTTAVIKVLRTSHETATVTGEAEISVNCFGIVCTYKGEGLEGTAKGPLLSTEANGEVNISEQVVTGSGSFCPSEGKLDIKTTALMPVYIGKGGALHYCVEYEHAGRGYYLNNTCTTQDSTRLGNFALVIGPAGKSVGDTLCVHLLDKVGLWKKITNGVCEEDDTVTPNTGLYEKGIIKTVQ